MNFVLLYSTTFVTIVVSFLNKYILRKMKCFLINRLVLCLKGVLFFSFDIPIVLREELPEGATLLSSVWQMKRKRKPSTGEISKYKARMNVDGSQMIKGLHYEETYAPVVQWATIRFFISLAILSNWHTRQLDFVLAYTQAHIFIRTTANNQLVEKIRISNNTFFLSF